MKKRILILGVSSFGGSSFFKYLNREKKYKIWGTYRKKSNLKKLFNNFKNNYNFIKLDLSAPNNRLIKIISKIKPHYIFDFASVCLVNESWLNPNYYFKVNFYSKIQMVENFKNFNFMKKFIYISTPEVFGSTKLPAKENQKVYLPSTPYALSKLNMENLLSTYNNRQKKSIIVRASNFYGLDQLEHRLIPKLIKFLKSRKKFPLHGKGDSKRNFIFEDDFNKGLVKLIRYGKCGDTYHFSSQKHYSIKNIVKMMCNLLNVKYEDYVYKVKDRIGKDKFYFLNCNKTKKQLNWKANVNIEDGLKRIIKYKQK